MSAPVPVVDDVMAPRRPWARALLWLVLLAPFFFISYGYANRMASAQAAVPSIAFDWEHAIPFWPWTIVPYWSIDLFYGISLLVCTTRRELDMHALRLLTVQLVCVACFLLFPLTFSFERPAHAGAFGWMFDALAGFDKPFNQAPSLHIALLVVLWLRFAAHVPTGAWRWLLHVWFALIGLSVLTTFQHHFVDVPTGALAGFFAAWLWPGRGVRAPWRRGAFGADAARGRLAVFYAAGALAAIALAFWLRGFALWLCWPAVSLLLVACGYAWSGATGLQKRSDGTLSVAARWLMAPYLLGAWINSRWWTRRAAQPRRVAGDVWLGRIPTRGEREGFDCVVDLCAEIALPGALAGDVILPMLDLVVPDAENIRAAAQAIAAVEADGRVLVCCALGFSRSALAVAAWLLASGRANTVEDAVARVRGAKPDVVLKEPYVQALRDAFAAETAMHGNAAS